VQTQLEKIVASATLSKVPKQKRLLRFLVEKAVAGHRDHLKGQEIARELFDGDDVGMRLEAHRLRKSLLDYYHSEAPQDIVRIDIPKKTYVPTFSLSCPPDHLNEECDTPLGIIGPRTSPVLGSRQLWSIPSRNPFFTGRDEYFPEIRNTLLRTRGGWVNQPHAISGLGGIGKTQIAIEYAHRYHGDYTSAFWVCAESRDSLLSGYLTIAALLNLPHRDERDLGLVADSVLRWFSSNSGWLLILDNVEEINVIKQFLPARSGDCLITTRLPATYGTFAENVALKTFDPPAGALFLLTRAKMKSAVASSGAVPDDNVLLATKISQELGGLPLALDQAGAFIEETPSTISEYWDFYRNEGARLRAKHGEFSTDHHPVANTFGLALKRTEVFNAASAAVVRASAFLSPDAIPEELFAEGGSHLGEALAMAAKSPLAITEALSAAARFALIHRHQADKTFSIHRLVQVVTLDQMDHGTQSCWVERVVHALSHIFPSPSFSNWDKCERLVSHAKNVALKIGDFGLTDVPTAQLLCSCGSYLCQRGQYAEARKLLEDGFGMFEKVLGPENAQTAAAINELAGLHCCIGNFREAEYLYSRALTLRRNTLGSEHPDTATTLNSLGDARRFQIVYGFRKPSAAGHDKLVAERLENALECYLQALTIRQKVLGPEHPDTATSLTSVAALYRTQRKTAEADKCYRQALSIRRSTLGPEHPNTAAVLNELGLLYHVQEQYSEANSCFRDALAVYEKALGSTHPDVAACLDNFAALLRDVGRGPEAQVVADRARLIQTNSVNWQTSERLKSVVHLIDESVLPDPEKKEVIYDVCRWGLTDRVRDLCKDYCLNGIRILDHKLLGEYLGAARTTLQQLTVRDPGPKDCSDLSRYYEDASKIAEDFEASGELQGEDLREIKAQIEEIGQYLGRNCSSGCS
jgi:tetratricopeptide (TPR) repeat protein